MKKFYILLLCLATFSSLFAKEVLDTNTTIETETTLVSEVSVATILLNDQTKEKVRTIYNEGKLTITGINTTSNIAIYNLLGRKVIDLKNVSINGTYSKYLDLPRNNIYIVKITSPAFSKTFKIIAK